MKKFKKIFAVLLTLAMVLGMSMTTFAGTSGSIKITGLKQENTEVKIYNIAKLDANGNAWEVADWANDIAGAINIGTNPYTINVDKLAEEIKKEGSTVQASDTKTTSTGTVEFSSCEEGVYLVLATTKTEGSTITYNPMLAVTYTYDAASNLLTGAQAVITAKYETIPVDKKAKEGDKYVAVGQDAHFTIDTIFPSFHGENGQDATGTFKIVDTPKNLSIKEKTVTVTVGGVALTKVNDYTLDINSATGVMTVEFTNTYIGNRNAHSGAAVVISYDATVTGLEGGIKNTAHIWIGEKDSGEVTENVYPGEITMTKTGEDNETLSGAEFVVYYKDKENTKHYAEISNGVVTGWTTEESEAGKITTGEQGTATINGLDANVTYYFKEVKAPNGYTINTTDKQAEWTEAGATAANRTGSVSMSDTKLASLPSTGGIGTTIFTIGGCAIMIIAAALFFASRRKSSK